MISAPRFRRVLFAALAGPGAAAWAVLLLGFTSLPWRCYRWLGSDEFTLAADPRYIVVLGGGGIPSESGLMRTYRAAEEARRFPGAAVILALPVEGEFASSGTGRMQAELVLRGIAAERILIEPEGRNTREQALNVRRLLEEDPPDVPVLLVTSPEHLRRSLAAFRRAGLTAIAGSAVYGESLDSALAYGREELGGEARLPVHIESDSPLRYEFWNQLGYLGRSLRELAALAYYWAKGWI
ncbi:MAG: YdcF family protein [Kiritimatiellae bacterium]|nr:YdcF family protein [Kiritimatiellia bacterium]